MVFVDKNNKLLSRKEVIEIGYEHLLEVKDATKIEWADTLPRFVQITDLPLNETEVSVNIINR